MDRQEIEQEYNVSPQGNIQNPGKFEGEPLYTVYFWDLVMDGCGDTHWDADLEIKVFTVTPEELVMFPELEGITTIAVYESEVGFVFLIENPDLNAIDAEDQISVDECPRINLADWGIADDLHIDPDRKDEWTDKRY